MDKQLKATSNVIELKKDRKYIFVFDHASITFETMQKLQEVLSKEGITGIHLILEDSQGLTVFEKEV